MSSKKLKVVICWHMHQPEYCDLVSGEYKLPWTYLHGIKDYVDMVAHLENYPNARAVVNFAPTLLEQLEDYAKQIQAFLKKGTHIKDPLLAAFIGEDFPTGTEERFQLIDLCLRSNHDRIIERFAPYKKLAEISSWLREKHDMVNYLDEQYLIDLLMWYHLGWMGETVRRNDPRIKTLMDKAHRYTMEDRRDMLSIMGDILNNLLPRYKALLEKGQIEISVTPYAHPIVPLLIDFQAARDAVPDIPLPNTDNYPEGKKRVEWHMRNAIKTFKKHFGAEPTGCWPSEGGISESMVQAAEKFNFKWVASGQQVLQNSLNLSELTTPDYHVHRPYHLPKSAVKCFFRDDGLSDNIGFRYTDWHGDDAVGDLVHHLENIAKAAPETGANVVSIILDGENAWEYYHENGYYFLDGLYKKLSEHDQLEMTTFADCVEENSLELPKMAAGSWVYGSFTTWIGDKDKNRGWEMLVEAKHTFDKEIKNLKGKAKAEAERQLAICEGSDWCWWFGDYNPSSSVQDFDRLYRLHLMNLYHALGKTPPDYLLHAFTHGGGNPAAGGTMRRGQE